jgi:acetyl esterase/lipase
MPSIPSRLVPVLLRVTRANRPFVTVAGARREIDDLSIRPQDFSPPRRLRSDVSLAVDHGSGWPIYTVAPKNQTPRGGVVYLHGGGWVHEIAKQHWQLVAQIAAEVATTVTVPIYPLVPFGTADAVVPAVAKLVLDSISRYGNTSLAGDSAGGQIALSAALVLRDEHQVTLPQTVLISPALDLSLTNPDIERVQPTDPWLGRDGNRVIIEHWRGKLPISDPRVSPLAAELQGLGPLTVFSGTRDILNPDARILNHKATAAGVDIDYHEQPGLVHVFALTPTPEGRAARTDIIDCLRATHPAR